MCEKRTVRSIAFIVILSLIIVFPMGLPDSKAYGTVPENVVDMSTAGGDVTISSDGIDTVAMTGSYVIASGESITITGSTSDYGVTISGNDDVDVTLSGTSIDVSGTDNKAAADITNKGDTNITLKGINVLKSGSDSAGLQKNGDVGEVGALTINGGSIDSLDAQGGNFGADIGSNSDKVASNITIIGGNITAKGANNGAGIGSGYDEGFQSYPKAKNIVVSGGNVNAIGGYGAAGIGSGTFKCAENITISGGFVTAEGGTNAEDIGSDLNAYDESTGIKLIGGSIFADFTKNSGTSSPTTSDGAAVYKVTVPSVSIPERLDLKGNKLVTVPLDDGNEYKAKTVSTGSPNEHGSDFPADAAAYIYLPTTSAVTYTGITVGEYLNGYAEVVSTPTLSNQNIILGLEEKTEPQPPVPETYFIKASKSGYGTISPSGNTKVSSGDDRTFTITPNKGYHIKSLVIDGKTVKAVSKYTFSDVKANHSITAYFAPNKYRLTFNGNKGKIKGAKTKIVIYNAKVSKLPTAKRTGYKFKGWYTQRSGGKKITSSTKMRYTRDMRLYAHWSKNAKIVKCFVVRVHKNPSKNSKTIRFAKRGTKVCYIKKLKNGWVKVKVGNKTGYVDRRYVRKI